MPSCCYSDEYGAVFTPKEARANARKLHKSGLTGTAEELATAVSALGVDGSSLLEVGGGLGGLHLALLGQGAASAVNVDLSDSWEEPALSLLEERGMTGRVERLLGDFVDLGDRLPRTDIVLLHRVVCCYPDWRGMLDVAASKSQWLLGLTFPIDRSWTRLAVRLTNLTFRIRRLEFRSYVHPADSMLRLLQGLGMSVIYDHSGPLWRTMVWERPSVVDPAI